MLDIFRQLATDEQLEVSGTWKSFGGAKFLIARAGNPRYTKFLTDVLEKHKADLEVKGEASDKLSMQLLVDTIAETLLLDWQDVSFRGVVTPYSKEAAREALAVKDFRVKILLFADDLSNFLVKEEATQAGN